MVLNPTYNERNDLLYVAPNTKGVQRSQFNQYR